MREKISTRARIATLVAMCGMAAAVVSLLPRFPQDPRYHDFADQRTLLAIPNALNVLSNIPFAIVGGLGIWLVGRGTRQQFAASFERLNYLVFFVAVGMTAAGSSYYHLMPTNQTLLWDRLPMSIGFMSLLAAMLAERISVRAGAWLLWPLVVAGIMSLVWWHWTEQAGRGDLRPYALVQFDGLLAVVLLLTLFPPRYTRSDLLWWAVGLYAAAKALEAADRPVWALTGHEVSGHTVKHLAPRPPPLASRWRSPGGRCLAITRTGSRAKHAASQLSPVASAAFDPGEKSGYKRRDTPPPNGGASIEKIGQRRRPAPLLATPQ